MRSRTVIAIFFAVGVLLTLGISELYTAVIVPSLAPPPSLDERYHNAIEDAMITQESEVYSGLTPITLNNSNLIWRGEGDNATVLVVTWTRHTESYPVNDTLTTSWGETWVTVVPEIQAFFHDRVNADTNATVRAAELLGLPANTTNTAFVELWVHPQSLFRPSPDSEIDDTVASLSFPDTATSDYRAWFNGNIIYSYYPMKYPWTRLGYTYDWGNTQTHVGLSEFVLRANSTVTVQSVTPTAQYLGSS